MPSLTLSAPQRDSQRNRGEDYVDHLRVTMDEVLFQVMTGLKIHLGVRSRGEIQKKEILQTITIREAQEEISSFVILLLLFYFVVKTIYYIKHNRKMKQIYKIN